MAKPPGTRIDHEVVNCPVPDIDDEAGDVSDLSISGMDVISHDCIATVEMGIVVLVQRRFTLGIGPVVRGAGGRWSIKTFVVKP